MPSLHLHAERVVWVSARHGDARSARGRARTPRARGVQTHSRLSRRTETRQPTRLVLDQAVCWTAGSRGETRARRCHAQHEGRRGDGVRGSVRSSCSETRAESSFAREEPALPPIPRPRGVHIAPGAHLALHVELQLAQVTKLEPVLRACPRVALRSRLAAHRAPLQRHVAPPQTYGVHRVCVAHALKPVSTRRPVVSRRAAPPLYSRVSSSAAQGKRA